jgi:DNA-binding NarL/FixJ family response regulator
VEGLQTRLCALPGASIARSTIYKRAKRERLLVPRYSAAQGTAGPITAATNTQRLRAEITELMAAGHRNRAIAEQMGEPLSVVLAHVAAIEAARRAAAP